jgi:hypothetical protein
MRKLRIIECISTPTLSMRRISLVLLHVCALAALSTNAIAQASVPRYPAAADV